MAPLRLLPILLLALLLAPGALATEARVSMAQAGDAWNVVSTASVGPSGDALVWVAPGARLHNVSGSDGPASWSAEGSRALRIHAPGSANASAAFDVPAGRLRVLDYAAPEDLERLTLEVAPANGLVPVADGLSFVQGSDGRWRAQTGPLARGDALAVRAVEPGRVGELPVLVTVGILALVVLAGTYLWHRVRPPLQGREPQGFLEHLAELQARLLPPVVVFALLNLFYFVAGLRTARVGAFDLVLPVFTVEGSLAARAFEAMAERMVPAGVQLVVLRPIDAVLAQVNMALFLAFATVLPLLAYELAVFVGPALEPHERRIALRVLPLVTGLFLAGALFAYMLMAPLMIRTLYAYAPAVGALPLLGVGDLTAFALLLTLAFGAAFELPVVMYVLSRLGAVRAATWRRYFRHAVVVIVLVSGIVTPDPSIVSQLLVGVPVTALYLLGIAAAGLAERQRARKAAAAPA